MLVVYTNAWPYDVEHLPCTIERRTAAWWRYSDQFDPLPLRRCLIDEEGTTPTTSPTCHDMRKRGMLLFYVEEVGHEGLKLEPWVAELS